MELSLLRPDDWHVHLRDGAVLAHVVPHTARRFARAVVMPNLRPPVRTLADALEYRARILAALPVGHAFEPLMTLYLTEATTPGEVRAAHAGGVFGVKYYPAGATTNSASGVRTLERLQDVFDAMVDVGMPLLLHGEVTDSAIDVFDREAVFIDRVLVPLLARTPRLRVVLEHITTREAVQFVLGAGAGVAATITAHHLLLDRNAMFTDGLRPHHYCLPLLKRAVHRDALIEAATGGHPRFFLGSDSAPHERAAKESACGCAGIFTGHAAIELYAEVFDAAGRLERLEGFASRHGATFHGLPLGRSLLRLVRRPWRVPAELPLGTGVVVPFRAGEECQWQIDEPVA